MIGSMRADPVMYAVPKTRVWVAGPERIVSFDCETTTLHAECSHQHLPTREHPEGKVTRVPARMVATDTHGRQRTIFLDGPQPYEIVMVHDGTPPEKPSESWLNAVEAWRLRRKMYPNQPEKWLWPAR